jgi:predicted nuclease with RNAse H fold
VSAVTADAREVCVGIDVAERRKGLDLVALDAHRRIVVTRSRLSLEQVVSTTISLAPAVVCVDSPSGWSLSERSRLAERQLASIGIQSFRTGPDPGGHPFYAWMGVGFEIFRRLSAVYPLYRGGSVAGTAAEVFPHASACLLHGVLRPASTTKVRFRRSALDRVGVAEYELRTIDAVDAALGALTGLIALEGGHSAVGDPNEGVILLPVAQLPPAPLTRLRPASACASHRPGCWR